MKNSHIPNDFIVLYSLQTIHLTKIVSGHIISSNLNQQLIKQVLERLSDLSKVTQVFSRPET